MRSMCLKHFDDCLAATCRPVILCSTSGLLGCLFCPSLYDGEYLFMNMCAVGLQIGPFTPSKSKAAVQLKVKVKLNLHGCVTVDQATVSRELCQNNCETLTPSVLDYCQPAIEQTNRFFCSGLATCKLAVAHSFLTEIPLQARHRFFLCCTQMIEEEEVEVPASKAADPAPMETEADKKDEASTAAGDADTKMEDAEAGAATAEGAPAANGDSAKVSALGDATLEQWLLCGFSARSAVRLTLVIAALGLPQWCFE